MMYEIQVCNVCLSVKHANRQCTSCWICMYVCMYVRKYVCMHACMDVRTYIWYGMVWYGMVWYGMVWYVMECNVCHACDVLYVTYAM